MRRLSLLVVVLCLLSSGIGNCQPILNQGGVLLVQGHLLSTGYLTDPAQIDGQYGNITDEALHRYALNQNFDLQDRERFAADLYQAVSTDSSVFERLAVKGYSSTQISDWLAQYHNEQLISTPIWVASDAQPTTSPNKEPSYTGTNSHSKGSGSIHVKGYYRKNGTYVKPYTRRRPRHR